MTIPSGAARARVNGAARRRRPRRIATLQAAQVVALLRTKGPHTRKSIALHFNWHYLKVDELMLALTRAQEVVILGTCAELGFEGGQRNANVYALPGTPKPERLTAPSDRARRRASGSGVIAGPKLIRGYCWRDWL